MAKSLPVQSHPDPQHSQVFEKNSLLRRSLSLSSLYLPGRILLEVAVKALASVKVTVRYSLDVLMEDMFTTEKASNGRVFVYCIHRYYNT
jgi:hypothetical protein